VDSLVLRRLSDYLAQELHGTSTSVFTPVASWSENHQEIRLRERVASLDFLSRFGRPDVASENEVLRTAAQLSLEDRARLAEILARRGQAEQARRLMEPTWAQVRVEGRRATLADSVATDFYFSSRMRPLARILMATLAVAPDHPLVGPLVETLAQQGRAEASQWWWNTQDYASSISALAAFERIQRARGADDRTLRVYAGKRAILEGGAMAQRALRDSSIALRGLLASVAQGQALRLSLDAGAGDAPLYYYLTVTEVPTTAPVLSADHGIQVERWYERFDAKGPTATVAEGDLVRVRLRITVPSTRYFVVLDDALPAGLEAVDLSLRTASVMPGPGTSVTDENPDHEEKSDEPRWGYGRWDSGWWSPFDHKEIRDDRVVYSASVLWGGTYTATYIARATTPGVFVRPPAHAEEMYNPAVYGRSDGGTFTVTAKDR
jgi:uncharacterized protein YfaS (alpha-2-macroglobulin family)